MQERKQVKTDGKHLDLICSQYKTNKQILSRPEYEKYLLFDPVFRKIHLISSLAYQVWASIDRIQTLSEFMSVNQLTFNEAANLLHYFLKERLIVEA